MRRKRAPTATLPNNVVPITVKFGDIVDEVLASTMRRPMRTALTALGTAIGVAAFVATLGLTSTAQAQVSTRFDALKATEISLQDSSPESKSTPLPADTSARLKQIDGVIDSAVTWRVFERPPELRTLFGSAAIGVNAVGPDYFSTVEASIDSGTVFNAFHDDRRERVAVLGRSAADRLGITTVERQPVVFVGDVGFTVVGIIGDTKTQTENLFSMMVPDRTAAAVFNRLSMPKQNVIIRTEPGAAQVVGEQAALVVRPEDPESLLAIVPPDPKSLRQQVEGDVAGLFVVLGAVCLIVGAIAIANTTLVSVMERVWEIGLRRSLGATRRAIATQFLSETTAIGAVGSLAGTSAGIAVVIIVSAVKGWTPVASFWILLSGPTLGSLAGLLAGIYPAWLASTITPIEALRR